MTRYMVWVVTDTEEGWGCSLCDWITATPELDTTVAALQYNRAAQQAFDSHECHPNGNGTTAQGLMFLILEPSEPNHSQP